MPTLENSVETNPCPHCGSPVRAGMIRCRECRGLLADTGDEFVLSPQVAAAAKLKCARCGVELEPGIDDCPSCASALLDDLMKGPEEGNVASRATEPYSKSQARSGQSSPATTSQPNRNPPPRPAGASKTKAPPTTKNIDDPPGLFGDEEDEYAPRTPARTEPVRPAKAPAANAAADDDSPGAGVETSAACTALLASLASADVNLRCEIAVALGKLGDKAAMGPLERHLVDQDIRVRRAVAAALVQLGHPRGETLLDIAERKPVAEVLSTSKPATPAAKSRPKAKRAGGGMTIDGALLTKLGAAIVAIAVVGGGIWYWMNSGSSTRGRRPRKSKSATTKTATPAPQATPGPAAPAPSGPRPQLTPDD